MSLETLLEAAEFLEWNKAGKKTASRATRTSKKAEKFKPYVTPERKRKSSSTKSPAKPSTSASTAATVTVVQTGKQKYRSSAAPTQDVLEFTSAEIEEMARMRAEEEQQLTLREIRKSIGNRETHNKLEKNRRAHLKECFEDLRNELPLGDERRASNLGTLRSALRLIEQLVAQQKELESEKRRIQRVRNARQAQINILRKELSDKGIEYNLEDWIEQHDTSTNSTSTAPECGEAMTDTVQAGVDDLAPTTAQSVPVNIQPAPEVQVFIKTIPKMKPVIPYLTGNVTLDGTPSSQGVQLIQQTSADVSASYQRLKVHPSTSGTSLSAAALQQQVQSTALHGVTVAKITQGNMGMPAKVMLTPKLASTAVSDQQQTVSSIGQLFVNSTAGHPTTSANIFITTAPQQAQPVTLAAAAGHHPATSTALTVNLQTGKVEKYQSAPHLVAVNRSPIEYHPNLNIAPKQLVLIAAAGQHQKLRVYNANSGTMLNAIAPAATPGSTVTLGTGATPHTTFTQHTSSPNLFPLNIQTTPQPATIKPTFISGVLPSSGIDGAISYVPIQLATRPSAPSITNSTTLPTAFLCGSGGTGLTFVIPSVSNHSTSGVQLVTNHQPQAPTIQLAMPPSATNL